MQVECLLLHLKMLTACCLCIVPYGLAVRIPGFHPGGPGSTPGMGTSLFLFCQKNINRFISLLQNTRYALCINFDRTQLVTNGNMGVFNCRLYDTATATCPHHFQRIHCLDPARRAVPNCSHLTRAWTIPEDAHLPLIFP